MKELALSQDQQPNAGSRFRQALLHSAPLQIVGVINAYCALLAEQAGFQAIYLSGAGVANASYGIADLGFTSLANVLEDVGRIVAASQLPLLVDIDTGWQGSVGVAATIQAMEQAGVAAVQMEDQVEQKRCGHRQGKQLVSTEQMCERLAQAVDARVSKDFVIMARTDALAGEGLDAAIARAQAYIAAGADMIFAEAIASLDDYQTFCEAIKQPVLANITEFGKTPLFTAEQLAAAGVSMALYPLSAFRAMSRAAENVYQTIKEQGTQKECVDAMQTREQLYQVLNYYELEQRQDQSHEGK